MSLYARTSILSIDNITSFQNSDMYLNIIGFFKVNLKKNIVLATHVTDVGLVTLIQLLTSDST